MKKLYDRKAAQQVAKAGQRKRQLTINNLIARIRAEGREPTAAEIAGLLAATEAKIVRHLSAMGLRL